MSLILNGTTGLSNVDGTAAAPAIIGTDTNTGIFFPAADTIAFAEGGAEAMRIDSSGNVGIGTSSPAYKVDVTGAIRATNTSNTTVASAGFDATTSWGLEITNASTTAGSGAGIYFLGGTNSESYIGNLYESSGAGALSFQTRVSGSRAERMRIDSSGNLLVGTTSHLYANTSRANIKAVANSYGATISSLTAGYQSLTLLNEATSGTRSFVQFSLNANGSTDVGSITSTGTTTVYGTTSDYRLKENIAPMTGALAKVAQLKPVTYKWKSDGSDSQGFIAHELQAVVPECVVGEKDAVKEQQYEVTSAVKDDEGNIVTEAVMGTRIAPVYQGIDTSFLVATLTAAIQELKAIVDTQAARITALEAA